MSKRKKDCVKLNAAQFVRKDLCDERSTRVTDSVHGMEQHLTDKISGVTDKLTGIEKKVDGIIADKEDEKKRKSHEIRNALLAILSGTVIALFAWGLAHLHF